PHNLASLICTENEFSAHQNTFSNIDPFKLLFSIKESAFKCLYPYTKCYFDFKDIEVVSGSDNSVLKIALLNKTLFDNFPEELNVKYALMGNRHILTAVFN